MSNQIWINPNFAALMARANESLPAAGQTVKKTLADGWNFEVTNHHRFATCSASAPSPSRGGMHWRQELPQ